jgi:hypothetical protein
MGQKATWLRSSGLECFVKLCDHRQRYCGAVVPVTRLALVAFGVFSGTGRAPRLRCYSGGVGYELTFYLMS